MPRRKRPLVNGEIYHIFNKSIDKKPSFVGKRECDIAIRTIAYYRHKNPPLKFSRFRRMKDVDRKQVLSTIKKDRLVDILSFCFMPNHFHFLLKQNISRGISIFMSNFLNSYTRYFNTRKERVGPLFLSQFKAVRVETEEQLIHLSRYIHLNPYTSYVVKDALDLENYIWSSLVEYFGLVKRDLCRKNTILSYFKNNRAYKNFIYNHAAYQRELKRIEHLALE